MSEEPVITVMCVDDSPDIVKLMDFSVRAERDMRSVGCLTGTEQLVDEVARLRPAVMVIDLTMPGADPLSLLPKVGQVSPDTRPIVFSGYDGQEHVDRAMDAGAWGYVSKHNDMNGLIRAIRRVAKGEIVMPGS